MIAILSTLQFENHYPCKIKLQQSHFWSRSYKYFRFRVFRSRVRASVTHAKISEKVRKKSSAQSSVPWNAPPTIGAPLVPAPSEAPSDESALFLSRLSRWMVAVMLDGHARIRTVVPIVGSVVPTPITGHRFRTFRVLVVPLPYSRSKTFRFSLFLSLSLSLFLFVSVYGLSTSTDTDFYCLNS